MQVVKIIRAADDSAGASRHLQQSFGMSQEQLEGVLNLSLRRLTSLEAKNLQAEHDVLVARHALMPLHAEPQRACRNFCYRGLIVSAFGLHNVQSDGSGGLVAAAEQGA